MGSGIRKTPFSLRRQAEKSDFGTAERWQHAEKTFHKTEVCGSACVARVLEEHHLDALARLGVISDSMLAAALRLKRDFMAARLEAHWVAHYGPGGLGRTCERSDEEEEAYTRWRLAMRAMGCPYNNVVATAVCHDKEPPLEMRPFIQTGLARLAKWYAVRPKC